ncbi:TetR/AcrR family transcriptional regulator [Agromyces sp. NPDC058484]|uniref:TetR/AcrR family transcriptional regulator n=1 Tax=Agromyces sp. NPDC058484 TaxID=3346524 RepID=UPI003648C2A5
MDDHHVPRRRGRPAGMSGRELLAVAREVLLERGYAGTTMDEVAARARVSKASLYRAHPSKAELYAAVVSDWAASGRDSMRPALQRLTEGSDVRSDLLRLTTTMRDGILGPDVFRMRRLVTAEAATHAQVAASYLADSWNRNIDALADALADLDRQGRLDITEPRVAADQLTWLTVGAPLNAQLLTDGGNTTPDEQALSAAVDLFLAGYAADRGPGDDAGPGVGRRSAAR